MRTRPERDFNAEKTADTLKKIKDKHFKRQHHHDTSTTPAGHDAKSRRARRPDRHHSKNTPCCQPALEVMEKIFPGIISKERQQQQRQQTKDDAEGDEGGATAEEEDREGGALMDKLIRKHLLEERRKVLESQAGGTSSGKKKKKKKRKKTAAVAAAQSTATATGETSVPSAPSPEQGLISAAASLDTSASPSGVSQLALSSASATDKDEADATATSADASASAAASPSPVPAPAEDADTAIGPISAEEARIAKDNAALDSFLDKILLRGDDSVDGSKDQYLPPNRDLASFVTYLNARYAVYLQQTARAKQNKRFDKNERIYKTSEVIPSVQYGLLERYCEAPTCYKCQRYASAVLIQYTESTGLTKYSFDLDDSCMYFPEDDGSGPPSGKLVTFDAISETTEGIEIENAFDYVALEEGLGGKNGVEKLKKDRFHIVVEGIVYHKSSSAVDDIARFMRPRMVKERPEMLELVPPAKADGDEPCIISMKSILRLITRILVPGGLDLNAIEEGSTADDDNIFVEDIYTVEDQKGLIHGTADNYIHEYAKTLNKLESIRDKIKDLEREALESRQQGDFAAKASKALRNCEEGCDDYLAAAAQFVLCLSKMSVGVCSSDGRVSDWARTIIQSFMDAISNAHSALIKPSIAYKKRVLQTSKRPGSVPLIAFSASHRDEFENMLNFKIEATRSIQKVLDDNLLAPSPPHPEIDGLHLLCSASAYYAFPNETPFVIQTDANKLIDDLLGKWREMCWMSSSHTVIKESLLEKQIVSSGHFARALDEFERAIAIENAKLDDVGDDLGSLTDIVSKQTLEEVALGDQAPDLQFVSLVEEKDSTKMAEYADREIGHHSRRATFLISKWWLLILRQNRKSEKPLFQAYKHDRPRLNELPRNFLQWIKDNHAVDENDGNGDKEECPGYGATRRVSCLIGVLLYDWFQERCVEWNAEITQKELLLAMENDEELFASEPLNANNTAKGSGKASKKKKKKAKKKPAPAPAPAPATAAAAVATVTLPTIDKTEPESTMDSKVDVERENEAADDTDSSGGWIGVQEKKKPSPSDIDSIRPSSLAAERPSDTKKDEGKKSPTQGKNKSKSKSKVAKATKASKVQKKDAGENKESDEQASKNQARVAVPKEDERHQAQAQEELAPFEYKSKVSVQDGSQLIPAEYFFVRRLKAVLSQAKENASTEKEDKAAENIVFL